MSGDDSLAHYGVKGMKWGKTKAAVSKTLDVSGAISKAIINAKYDNKKADLKAEAFISDILGKPSNAKRDLKTLDALEELVARGQKSIASMDTSVKVKKP